MPSPTHRSSASSTPKDVTDVVEKLFLRSPVDLMFEFVTDIEMIFDGAFAASRHDGDFVHTCRERFFNAVLNERLVDHR